MQYYQMHRKIGEVMNIMNDLIENIDRIHTTDMSIERIKRNLQIETDDVVQWSREQILNKGATIERDFC